MKHRPLFFVLLVCFTLLFLFSMGEWFWGESSDGLHWTNKLFSSVCHSLPSRTFSGSGLYMAVNTRCFGIFLGLLAVWMIIPILKIPDRYKKLPVYILLFALFLQIIDYSGNLFSIWENTNISRFILGILLGSAASASISSLFHST